jgi:hypothetical protein
MIGYGAEVSSEQAKIIVSYLAKNFGKNSVHAQVHPFAAAALTGNGNKRTRSATR